MPGRCKTIAVIASRPEVNTDTIIKAVLDTFECCSACAGMRLRVKLLKLLIHLDFDVKTSARYASRCVTLACTFNYALRCYYGLPMSTNTWQIVYIAFNF